VPLQERSIYFLAPESDGAVFRLHSNIVVSSLRWRNDLSLSEKTINVSRWGTRCRIFPERAGENGVPIFSPESLPCHFPYFVP